MTNLLLYEPEYLKKGNHKLLQQVKELKDIVLNLPTGRKLCTSYLVVKSMFMIKVA